MIAIEEFRGQVSRWLLNEARIPSDTRDFERLLVWQRDMYEAGFLGIDWPTEFGGRGLTAQHQFAFQEELAAADAPPPVSEIGLDVVGPTLLKHASKEQCIALVPRLLSGEDIWCQGFSEPDAGSDLASLRTEGVVEGDELVINGAKVWTSYADRAAWCAVLLRTGAAPRHGGLSFVIVPMDSPGILVRPVDQITGDADFCEVVFDDVRVPITNLIGRLDDGWHVAMDTLSHERATYALRRLVEAKRSWKKLVDFVQATPVEKLPHGFQARLGHAFLGLCAFEAQLGQTRLRALRGEASPLDSLDKLLLARTEQEIHAVELDLWGVAASDPGAKQEVVHDYLFSRAASIYGGTGQIQRNIVAERLLGLPRWGQK